jgi:outer membrane protein
MVYYAAPRQHFWCLQLVNKDKIGNTLRLTPNPSNVLGFDASIQEIVIIPKEQIFGSVEVSQTVYDGKFFPLKKKSLQTIDKTTANYFQIIQDVLFQVAETYYAASKAEELVKNDQELIKLAQEQLRLARSKFDAGAVTEEVVINAELDLTSSETKLIVSKSQLKMAKDTLCNLIGIQTDGITLTKPPTIGGNTEPFDTLLERALEHRYDYRMAQLDIDLAKSDVTLQKTRFHPVVQGNWSYYSTSEPGFLQESNNWLGSVQVRLPLLEGGLRVWDLKEKKESLRQTKLNLDDRKRDIKIQVENAMLEVENYKALLDKSKKQVELAQKNYNIVFSKFNYGTATIFDLNQAFTVLGTTKTDLIIRNFESQLSLLTLDKMQGIFAIGIVKSERDAIK